MIHFLRKCDVTRDLRKSETETANEREREGKREIWMDDGLKKKRVTVEHSVPFFVGSGRHPSSSYTRPPRSFFHRDNNVITCQSKLASRKRIPNRITSFFYCPTYYYSLLKHIKRTHEKTTTALENVSEEEGSFELSTER